jgi:hypothetical protein
MSPKAVHPLLWRRRKKRQSYPLSVNPSSGASIFNPGMDETLAAQVLAYRPCDRGPGAPRCYPTAWEFISLSILASRRRLQGPLKVIVPCAFRRTSAFSSCRCECAIRFVQKIH